MQSNNSNLKGFRILSALAMLVYLPLVSGISFANSTSPWPLAAERSAPRLTPLRELSLSLDFGGAYVPQVGNLAVDSTAVAQGGLVWNLALFQRFALFGQHTLTKMWWGNSALLNLGCELGLRYATSKHLTLETAYLNHRLDRAWAGDLETRPGGVVDYGFEIGAWLHFQPMKRLRMDFHFIGRIFDVYLDTQGVMGLGLRVSLLPFDGHALTLETELLRVERNDPRIGVEKVTWNTVARIQWRSEITDSFGIALGGLVSTNLLVGQVPMLELRRSMINEPLALATVGVFFGI